MAATNSTDQLTRTEQKLDRVLELLKVVLNCLERVFGQQNRTDAA